MRSSQQVLWALGLTLCMVGSVAFAQERCGELLQQGIYDTWFDSSDVQQRQQLHQALCSRYNSNRSSGAGLGINIPIEGVPIGLDFSVNQMRAYGKAFCSEETTWNERLVETTNLRTIASQHVVNGYVECLRLNRKGVRYRVYYPQVGVGDLELEISEPADGRLPVYKGMSITPEEAVSCAFVDQSDAPPRPDETLSPAFYHLRCMQEDLQSNASVVVALDGAPAMHLTFRGHGDLKSNEARGLEGALNALGSEVRRFRSEFDTLQTNLGSWGECAWRQVGYRKSHYAKPDGTQYCNTGEFLVSLDDDSGHFGWAQCCKINSETRRPASNTR